jgi:glycogen(starch) synthase
MRILQVAWEFPPVIEGGLGRHVAKLSAGLAAAGHEVHVLTRGPVASEEVDGVHVHRVEIPPFTRDMDAFMAWVDELNARLAARGAELLEANHFDLIHSHDWMVSAAGQELAAAVPAPWLVTVHATEFGRHNGWVHTHPQREIHLTERRMVRATGHVICCSEYMAGHVRRVFGVADSHVSAIPNGVDPVELIPAPGTDLAAVRATYARPDERLVLMVGRLVYEKGFQVALDALATLAAGPSAREGGSPERAARPGGLPRIRFVLAGTGTAEADLHAQAAALGLSADGAFLGRVDDDLLHALYAVADVCVVPSLYEPFGIVPLEAMAAGCPVVVSDTGGLREVIATRNERPAVVVPPDDPAALAAGLAAVLGDAGRREAMRRAGRAHAAGFDWTAVAGQTEGVYAELISSRERLGV